MASECGDTHLRDFLNKEFLRKQIETINKLTVSNTNLQSAEHGLLLIYDNFFRFHQHLLS